MFPAPSHVHGADQNLLISPRYNKVTVRKASGASGPVAQSGHTCTASQSTDTNRIKILIDEFVIRDQPVSSLESSVGNMKRDVPL